MAAEFMHIRAYQNADEAQVVDLWQRCGLVVPWNDPRKDIQRKVDNSGELFFVGEIEGIIVGAVMAGYDGHRGWLNYLAVCPDQRKQGLGRCLLAYAEQALDACGCPKVNLQIRDTNEAVKAFYLACGYTVDPVISMGKRIQRDDSLEQN